MAITLEIVEAPKPFPFRASRKAQGLPLMAISTDAKGWRHFAYIVRLRNSANGAEIVTPWKQGTGVTEAPNAADVLASLLMDSAGYLNSRDIDDWASDYGIEKVSEAVESYRAIEAMTRDLYRFLGAQFHEATNADDHEAMAAKLTAEDATC